MQLLRSGIDPTPDGAGVDAVVGGELSDSVAVHASVVQLEGTGKLARHIKVRGADQLKDAAVHALIQAAAPRAQRSGSSLVGSVGLPSRRISKCSLTCSESLFPISATF